ncbi:helix-turn-helix transcriptional regulator [Cohnella nanjingensis]|uniref:AraC family transcriptional regulator n=1 Tax=Cohnella nanjingensis TaxID=1387779 RepID=A0A7X0RXA4_9BACL|nr:AraC family transcriptional regulator [Cohnella nanjingensis]MBB6674055.1 AraC family transcriptional regulator [Cohnella nanjingensis]
MIPYRERAEHAWTADSIRLIHTPSAFVRSALPYVQEIGRFRALPAYYTERERLDSFLLVHTLSGQGRLTYRSKTHALLPGQLFFIDCMDYQHYATAETADWAFVWAHLNGEAVRAYYERFARRGEPVRQLASESQIPRLLLELLEMHRFKSVRNELLASRTIVELLTELVVSGLGDESSVADMPGHVSETLRLIDKRYAEKLTLADLAKSLAVDKYHLAKAFKKHTGFSPGEYIIRARITRAKELLKYSDHPVAEIAEQIGIDNVSHFINLFKARTDQTPLAFRKTWQRPD